MLEEFQVILHHTFDDDPQHALLVVGPTDQAAYALQALAFGLHDLVLGFHGQKQHPLVLLLGDHCHGWWVLL